VLEALGLGADDVLFVGDSEHDVAAARTAGVRFAPARWNPRAARLEGDVMVSRPQDLLAWC
jgi:phosphoglycolate phosphatase-like HAD superfamily hydrolase